MLIWQMHSESRGCNESWLGRCAVGLADAGGLESDLGFWFDRGQFMQEIKTGAGSGGLSYEIIREKVFITGYSGQASEVEVPPQIERYPVAGIARKAFLSRKFLRRVVLPDTLEEVGDWAFAYCGGLVSVSFPRRKVQFGKAVFLECAGLRRIEVRAEGAAVPDAAGEASGDMRTPDAAEVPELLAAVVTTLDAYYLLDLMDAGSREWLDKWDARLAAVLHTPDDTGYSRQVLCGEEDYGSTDLGGFTSGSRKRKVRLAFLRLLHGQGLKSLLREELADYLRRLTKGQPMEEAWIVIREEHGDDREYYRLFAELGCVDEGNLERILAEIGEEHPEMKAFFLKFREERLGGYDFFAGLEL